MTATPPGWPGDLPGPGEGLAENVTGWLLDRLPPEYRTSPLRRHPLVLAMCARLHAQATLAGTRDVYRDLRAELRDHLDPTDIQAALVGLEDLAAQFGRSEREIELVEQALRGHVWRPRL